MACLLGASTLASWGSLERSWGTWEHESGHCGVQASIFWLMITNGFRIPILGVFQLPWTDKNIFFWMFVSGCVFLMTSGSESERLRLEKHVFGKRSVAKNNFAQMMSFCWFRCSFSWFVAALGRVFTNTEWRQVWNFMPFDGYLKATPSLRTFAMWCFLGVDSKTLVAEVWASDPLDTWP